jgi:hypothetical protein
MKSKIELIPTPFSPKKTPYDYLFYSFYANLPFGQDRIYFIKVWKELDKIIKEKYKLKKVIK